MFRLARSQVPGASRSIWAAEKGVWVRFLSNDVYQNTPINGVLVYVVGREFAQRNNRLMNSTGNRNFSKRRKPLKTVKG